MKRLWDRNITAFIRYLKKKKTRKEPSFTENGGQQRQPDQGTMHRSTELGGPSSRFWERLKRERKKEESDTILIQLKIYFLKKLKLK